MKNHFNFLVLILVVSSFLLLAQDKPLLSEAIQKAIDTKGIETAKKHFAESYESQKDFYIIDMNGIYTLSNSYMQNGKTEEAGTVMEIASPFMQYMIYENTNSESYQMLQKLAEMQQIEEEKQKKELEKEQPIKENKTTNFLGEARNDLERFTGLYGDPAESNKYRRLWVAVSCNGYLVSGAMWGDASPWWMKTEGDNVFSYTSSWMKLNMEFETDANGKAIRMIHDLSNMKNPLERLEPLPEEWESCIEPPERQQN